MMQLASKAANAEVRDPDPRHSRRVKNLACWSVVAGALALASAAGSPVFGQAVPDLWQTCEEASADTIKTQDFEMAAVMAHSALAIAVARDPAGWRPVLSRLPLMLAYVELDKPDLWKPIARENFRMDVARIDVRLKDFIYTARRLGSSFDSRWKGRQGRKEEFQQQARQYGAENLLKIEVALRERLMPEDEAGLADANALLGLAIGRRSARDSQERFGEARRHLKIMQQRRGTLQAMNRRFSVGEAGLDSAASDTDALVGSNPVFTYIIASGYVVVEAMDSLEKKEFDVFASKLALALDLLSELERSTSRMRASWPKNPLFGNIAQHWGWLHAAEFKMTKIDPSRYPDSFAKAKEAYEEALSIFEYSVGSSSNYAKAAARDYVDLLRDAGRTDEADNIARRYAIAAR